MAKFTRFPVVTLSAEYLVMGQLLRRNILTYKAPPKNEGYDLICIHPDPRVSGKQITVQVKSRYATDSDRGFLVREKTIDAFDYLIAVFLNIGYYLRKSKKYQALEGMREPEFYSFPSKFIQENLSEKSGWGKVRTGSLDITPYKNEVGFELIAQELGIPYPEKETLEE